MSGRERIARLGLALLAAAALAVGPLPLSAAAQDTPQTYPGAAYSADLPLPPTRTENQSKLWFHADAWWALLLEPTGRTVRVFELMPDHVWRPTSAVVNSDVGNVGDALPDGESVHVLTRNLDESLSYVRLSFDPAARDYRTDPPVIVTTGGSQALATIAKGADGRLWVSYATFTTVVVTYSDDGGRNWARLITLAETGTGLTPEAAAVVAYDDRVGVLWSDQRTGSIEFASHRDGDDPESWSREQALAGPALADDHISLRRVRGEPSDTLVASVKRRGEPSDTLVASVKTSKNDQGEQAAPLIELLIRAPDGQWSSVPVATVADGYNDAVLQVDEVSRTLHLFASVNGGIVTKRASLDDIRFEPGLGTPFMLGAAGRLVDPTVSKDPVDSRSGLVVLASDAASLTYRHAELPISQPTPVVDPSDQTPPNPPGGLQGRALSPETVALSWAEATDGDRWAPAREGVPVREYVVLRDGVEVATVTSTSLQDQPRAGADVSAEASFQYQVQAVDLSGNRSPPVAIVVDLPKAGTPSPIFIGISLLILAASAGYFAFRRRRLARAVTTRGRPDRERRPLSDLLQRSAR